MTGETVTGYVPPSVWCVCLYKCEYVCICVCICVCERQVYSNQSIFEIIMETYLCEPEWAQLMWSDIDIQTRNMKCPIPVCQEFINSRLCICRLMWALCVRILYVCILTPRIIEVEPSVNINEGRGHCTSFGQPDRREDWTEWGETEGKGTK